MTVDVHLYIIFQIVDSSTIICQIFKCGAKKWAKVVTLCAPYH